MCYKKGLIVLQGSPNFYSVHIQYRYIIRTHGIGDTYLLGSRWVRSIFRTTLAFNSVDEESDTGFRGEPVAVEFLRLYDQVIERKDGTNEITLFSFLDMDKSLRLKSVAGST
jgi:hypothetical protein